MPENNWLADWQTRRNLLKTGAAGGAAFIAGCSGDGDDGSTDDGSDGGGSNGSDGGSDGSDGSDGGDDGNDVGGTPEGGVNEDANFRLFDHENAAPPERHLNPWNPGQNGCWFPGAAMMDRPVVYSPTENEVYPVMVDDWEFEDDTTILVEFSDLYTWHNGDDFVAMDFVMEQQIELAVLRDSQDEDAEGPPHPALENIEEVDDYSCRVHMHTPYSEVFAIKNTLVGYSSNIDRGVFTKHDDDQWSEWHSGVWDTGSPDQETIEELLTTAYPAITDDPIGHGPFQLDDVGDNQMVLTRYGDHPHADEVNYGQFTIRNFPEAGQPAQPFINEEVDGTLKGFPLKNDLKSLRPDGTQLYREARSSNKLFAFNCGAGFESEYHVNDRRVRKAIAHVFNRSEVPPLLQGVRKPFEWPACRIPGAILRDDSHDATELVKNDFTLYGTNDTDRAAELLEDYGMEQDDDGTWLTPDGEPWEVEMLNAQERNDFNVLQQNLENFGVNVSMNSVDAATFEERRTNGNYQMIPDGSSANGIFAMWDPSTVIDWLANTLTNFRTSGVDIPMPIGDPEGSEGTKTIDIEEHIRNWQVEGDEQYHRELIWWWNQYIPEHENMFQPAAGGINTTDWELDAPDYITGGIDDAIFMPDKMNDMALRYTGD